MIGRFDFSGAKQACPNKLRSRYAMSGTVGLDGVYGNAGQTNYSASKAGIIGFTKSLAKEIGSRNILVNAVAPGFIKTEMTESLPEEVKENINKIIPIKRMGNVRDVANVVKFLASEDSSYITGQVINIDGGMLM